MSGRSTKGILTTLALSVALATPLMAQSLPQQNQEILNELKAIRQLLEKLAGPLGQPGGTPANAPSPISDKVILTDITGYVLGTPNAPLTMVEFTDLQCPFCRQFHITAFEQIKKDYIDTGKLRYISRDFPLEQLHPLAISAARVAQCAGEQGAFWEMRHTILLNNANLTPTVFTTFAQDLKLKMTPFQTCVAETARLDAEWQKDRTAGEKAGVSGTPSFVLGRTTATGVDGVRLVGAQPYAVFDAKLKELLTVN